MTLSVRFGLHLNQANKTWVQVLSEFQLAEELGFDTAWLSDHLIDISGQEYRPFHESWTLLSAIAARTSRIRLGILVTSNTFRHPAILAKEAVAVDHVSGGRLILGIGTGWNEDEHSRFGIDFPPAAVRVERLEETLQILQGLMSQPRLTFEGRHYRLVDAPLEPKPVQRPRIPILVGAHQPRMLRIAARYADQWDTFPTLSGTSTQAVGDDVLVRIRRLDAACLEIGRDPSEIRRSITPEADVFDSEAKYVEFVRHYRAMGFTDFTAAPPEADGLKPLRAIATKTIPALRAELDGQDQNGG